MFKFELDQVIFYMRENHLHSAKVLARMRVENQYEHWACTAAQEKLFTPFGPSREVYSTCHGFIPVEEAFASKQDLVEALV